MTHFHALILGLLQGLTEFLPVSSSGHLILVEHYLKLPFDPATLQFFNIVLHAGTLTASIVYFRKTLLNIIRNPLYAEDPDSRDGWWSFLRDLLRRKRTNPPLVLLLCLATIPVGIVGLLSAEWISTHAHTPFIVAMLLIVTGVVLLASSYYGSWVPGSTIFGYKQAIAMGIGQAFAIFPGLSRSGLSIASGRFAGLTAVRATEMSFLLGIPTVAAATLYSFFTASDGFALIGVPQIAVGFVSSMLSGLLVMHGFIWCLKRYGLWMWSVYLFVVGLLVLGDELLPLIGDLPELGARLGTMPLVSILFVALLLEAIPLTSTFVPGFTAMIAVGSLLHGRWTLLIVSILFGTIGLIAGHLIGYLPARQARMKIHWKEKADERLEKTQRFFEKYGFFAVFFGGWYGPFRCFISVAAGLSNMPLRKYLLAIVSGSLVWVTMVLLGSAIVLGDSIA